MRQKIPAPKLPYRMNPWSHSSNYQMVLACLHRGFLNAGIFRIRSRKHIRERPGLAEGCSTIWKGFMTWGNIPWIVMEYGMIVGRVADVLFFQAPGQEMSGEISNQLQNIHSCEGREHEKITVVVNGVVLGRLRRRGLSGGV